MGAAVKAAAGLLYATEFSSVKKATFQVFIVVVEKVTRYNETEKNNKRAVGFEVKFVWNMKRLVPRNKHLKKIILSIYGLSFSHRFFFCTLYFA